MSSLLRRLDWYRRVPRDLTESSLSGSLISIFAVLISLWLLIFNVVDLFRVTRNSQMLIDHEVRSEKLKINIDIKWKRIPCSLLTLDVQDVLGSHELDTAGTLWKEGLKEDGITYISQEEVKQEGHTGFSGLSRHAWNVDHQKDQGKVELFIFLK